MQALLDDSDQHIGAHGDPDLRLHGVLAGAQGRLDAQVLLDPFEEQLHLPALPVQVGDQLGLQCEVVGQKRDALAVFVLDHYAAQCGGVTLLGIEDLQRHRLIAQHLGIAPVHGGANGAA